MTKVTTEKQVRDSVADVATKIIADHNAETDRETIIEACDQACDDLFGQLVQHGRIDQYGSKDLARTAPACAAILTVAAADAWVEDDHGLEGIAFFSLRNLIYQALKDKGCDTNDEFPLAKGDE